MATPAAAKDVLILAAMHSLQTMSKAPTQPANLPPLQNLPSWSRNSLGRRKQRRPIIRDRLQPIKSIREEMDEISEDRSNELSNYSGRIVSAPSRGHGLEQTQRLDNIEKRLDYLRTQHAETLSNLHNEIERLKAENKELNFKLVMARTGVNLPKEDETSPSPVESDVLRSVDLVQGDQHEGVLSVKEKLEDKNLPSQPAQTVKESHNKNLTQEVLNSSAKRNKRHGSGKMPLAAKSTPSPPISAKGPVIKPKSSGKKKAKSYNWQEKPTSLNSNSSHALTLSTTSPAPVKQGIPLGQSVLLVTIKDKHVKVHMPTDSAPRSPTLVECKAIIKHQQETNKRQEQELSKLKSDLNDALYSDKWTPDTYLVTKSYVTDDAPTNTRQNTPASRSLPRLHSRDQMHSGRLTAGQMHVVQDSVSLPVLRPNGAANVADRKRRQQALVRGRGKKDFY